MDKTTRTCIVFFLTLLIPPLLFAQSRYRIVASNGSSAVIQRPADAQMNIGDAFIAKRTVNGREIDVARVRVAIMEANIIGFKIEQAMADSQLRIDDFVVPEVAKISDDLGFLDEVLGTSGNGDSENRSAPSANDSPAPDSFSGVMNQLENDQSQSTPDISFDDARSYSPNTTVRLQRKNYVGPTASFILPVSSSSGLYSAGPQLGLHGIVYFNALTNLRLNFQLARFGAGSGVKSALTANNASRTTWMSTLTVSVQPRIMNDFVLDLGAGYYRLLDRTKQSGRITTAIRNAPGAIAGFGYTMLVSKNTSVMVLATGSFYFLQSETGSFISLTASWLFGI